MRAITFLILVGFIVANFAADTSLGVCEYAAEVNCLGSKTLPDGTVLTKNDVDQCHPPHIPCVTLGFRPQSPKI